MTISVRSSQSGGGGARNIQKELHGVQRNWVERIVYLEKVCSQQISHNSKNFGDFPQQSVAVVDGNKPVETFHWKTLPLES